MTEPAIRPATRADIVALYGEAKHSMRAFVAELDGKPVAIAGIIYQEKGLPPYFFSEVKPEMRPHRKAILKGARQMLAAVGRKGLIAIACPNEALSSKLLRHLGFASRGMTEMGELMVYEGRP